MDEVEEDEATEEVDEGATVAFRERVVFARGAEALLLGRAPPERDATTDPEAPDTGWEAEAETGATEVEGVGVVRLRWAREGEERAKRKVRELRRRRMVPRCGWGGARGGGRDQLGGRLDVEPGCD